MNIQVRTQSVAVVVFSGLFTSWPADADANDSPSELKSKASDEVFGEAGQLALSGATQLNGMHVSFSTSGATPPSYTSFVIAPTGDIFIVRGLSLGARVAYSHQNAPGEPAANALSIGPRIGYNLTLGEHFSLWPSVNAAFGETWYAPDAHNQGISVGASAPLLYHPVAHIFLGFGPILLTYLTSTNTTHEGSSDGPRFTEYGAALTVGGWVPL